MILELKGIFFNAATAFGLQHVDSSTYTDLGCATHLLRQENKTGLAEGRGLSPCKFQKGR